MSKIFFFFFPPHNSNICCTCSVSDFFSRWCKKMLPSFSFFSPPSAHRFFRLGFLTPFSLLARNNGTPFPAPYKISGWQFNGRTVQSLRFIQTVGFDGFTRRCPSLNFSVVISVAVEDLITFVYVGVASF